MERNALSMRQMMVLLITALLAPCTDLLPFLTAQRAGSGGWLLPLGAIPLLLAAVWLGGKSHFTSSIIIIMYMGWTLLLLALSLRLAGVRLAEVYGEGPAFIYVTLLLAAAVWMGFGKTAALARAGEIFYLALAVALAGVLFLAAFQVEGSNLSLAASEMAAVPGGSLAVAGLILNVYPVAVLGRRVKAHPKNGRRAVGWVIAFGVAMALLLAAVIGCLGPKLTARLPTPFLTMVQGLGVKGAFQRTEALFAALWTLSDLVLVGLLLHAWRDLAGELRREKWGRRSLPAAAAIALIGGWLLFPSAEGLRTFCAAVLPMTGLFFGLICPFVLWIFSRRQKTGG